MRHDHRTPTRSASGRAKSPPRCPKDFDASLYFIGRIRTPWKERKDCPKNARESEAVCTIEVDPRWAPALKDVETCSHLVVLYWMDRSRRDIVLQVPRHYGVQRGTFSLRSPARPNPIAMSVVQLLKVEGNKLSVVGPRLPRRHAAARPQALFRLDRRGAGRRGRLAQGAQGLKLNPSEIRLIPAGTKRFSGHLALYFRNL